MDFWKVLCEAIPVTWFATDGLFVFTAKDQQE